MKNDSYEDIINTICSEKFVVYGAGAYANKCRDIVITLGCEDNYLFNVVSNNCEDDCKEIGLIKDVDRNEVVIIAAHDTNAQEMEENLKKLGFTRYYNIFPHLIELGCGMPYKKNVNININDFLKSCLYGDYLAIIYLAIDDIVNGNDIGIKMYEKYMNFFSTTSTTNKRIESLERRVNETKKDSVAEAYNIKINPKEQFILDGSHRIVLAKYFGIQHLLADLYQTKLSQYITFLGGKYLSGEEFKKLYSEEEYQRINECRRRELGQR